MTNLSIIVPIYNAESYLPACLDSLLKSDGIEKTEIVLIDDGSNDSSGSIADKYAASHDNISVIHTDNQGASGARNRGIREATGSYLFFCDSDDRVDPLLFGRIIELSGNSSSDVIMWDCGLFYETSSLLSRKDSSYFAHYGLDRIEKEYSGKEIMQMLIGKGKGVIASVCLGAYRRDYLLNNNLFFETGIIYEDELWIPRVLLNAESVHYIPEKIYIYRVHRGSVTNPESNDYSKNVHDLMYVYTSLYDYYEETVKDEKLKKIIYANLTKRFLHMIYKYRFWKYGYINQIDKKLLLNTSGTIRHKIMVLGLYLIPDNNRSK